MPLTAPQLRRVLEDMDAPELRALIEELFKANVTNRRLLTAKLAGDNSELLNKFHAELEKAFRTQGRLPTMRVGEARKALTAYVKVASPAQALDASLTFIEAGSRCLRAFGDWPESNYNSMRSVFESALKHARTMNPGDLPYTRLQRLAEDDFLELMGTYDAFLEDVQGRST